MPLERPNLIVCLLFHLLASRIPNTPLRRKIRFDCMLSSSHLTGRHLVLCPIPEIGEFPSQCQNRGRLPRLRIDAILNSPDESVP